MRKSIVMPVLAIVLATAVLFGLSFGLSETKAAIHEKQLQEKMLFILPGSTSFEEEEYTGEDANIVSVYKAENGYVILTRTHGYADDIELLVGVNNDGIVTGLQIRDMHETWGLGGESWTDWQFLNQFPGTDGSAEVGTNIDAITGATVTSKAVTRCVNSAVAFVTGADTESGATSWGG